MLKRVTLFGLLSILVLTVGACAPAAEEPEPEPIVEEAPPPPPPPTYELTEVAIPEEVPEFTSQNIELLGIKVGDITNDVADVLGDLSIGTIVAPEDYVTVYQDGGVVLYTFRQTGVARRIEITTAFADEIADPNLKAWLEDGDQSLLREWLGPEESTETVPENNNATEFVYDSRGLRFIQYLIEGQDYFAVRFSEM